MTLEARYPDTPKRGAKRTVGIAGIAQSSPTTASARFIITRGTRVLT